MSTRIVQMSDTHLFEDPDGILLETRTRTGTEAVINHIRENVGPFERLVISGDLVHEEGEQAYQELRMLLGDWAQISLVIPGNHDNRSSLKAAFAENSGPLAEAAVFNDNVGGWQLIGLDTLKAGAVEGEIEETQWDWLEGLLHNSHASTAIFMHHPAFMIGSTWLDQLGLLEPEKFERLISGAPQVKLISAGHVHQECSGTIAHAAAYTLPAASVQFAAGTTEFAVGDESPGYRIFDLEEDGSFTTEVVRVPVS